MSAPTIVQTKNDESHFSGTFPGFTTTQFTSLTAAGNAILVFQTESDFSTIWDGKVKSDTAGNTFVNRQARADTSQGGGAGSLFVHSSVNIVGDPTTAESITLGNEPTAGNGSGTLDDWNACYLIEVGNVIASPVVGASGRVQNALAAGTNNITAGNIVVSASQVPCILIGFCMNTSSAGTHPAPTAGTGMTSLATVWNAGGGNLGCAAYQNITTAGTYTATFNQASSATEDMGTVAIILQGAGSLFGRTLYFLQG